MLKERITELSKTFLKEASNSPTLFKDMAKMELYMSESYSDRLFVELLQNADDANATKMLVAQQDSVVYVANNGRPFSKEDVEAICRSGASQKKRGNGIGYRGVGFKSASYLSSDIIIYSDNNAFSFSKNRTAKALNIEDVSDVPTIRVPFLVENMINEEVMYLEKLKQSGYKTVFIFREAKTQKFNEELTQISNDYFLFLNNMKEIEIKTNEVSRVFNIFKESNQVRIISDKEQIWRVFKHPKHQQVKLALEIDKESGSIKERKEKSDVFHCFLPMIEKSGFGFKINGDFSTDPSRKHILMDDKTNKELNKVVILISETIQNIVNGKCSEAGFLALFLEQVPYYKISGILASKIKEKLLSISWVLNLKKQKIKLADCLKKPCWLENGEFNSLLKEELFMENVPIGTLTSNSGDIQRFVDTYSSKEITLFDIIKLLSNQDFVSRSSELTLGKLYGFLLQECRRLKFNLNDVLDELFIKQNEETRELCKFLDDNEALSKDFKDGINQVALPIDLKYTRIKLTSILLEPKEESVTPQNYVAKLLKPTQSKKRIEEVDKPFLTKSLVKWRATEELCVEIEKLLGYESKDVSKLNLGYDVESIVNPDKKRYVEAKLVKNGEFTMTNNEYTTASQLGEDYYLCLITEKTENLEVIYVRNPIKNLTLTKRIRQWEFFCDDFSGEHFKFDLK